MVKRNNQPDKNDHHQNKIELDLLYPHSDYQYRPHYCIFNLKGEFILYSKIDNTTDKDAQRNQLHFDNSDKIGFSQST